MKRSTRETAKSIKPETTFAQDVLHSLRDFASAVERGEPITVRQFHVDLRPRAFGDVEVRSLRTAMGVSQAMFARLLAVSVDLVQKWEGGTRRPQPVHCRLLEQIATDPKVWMDRVVRESRLRAAPKRPASSKRV